MSVFGQAKDLLKLQKEAREMQKKMKQLRVVGESDDERVRITVNGTQEVEDIEIADDLMNADSKKDLIKGVKAALKDSQKKLQKEMMKDMDISQLRNMLG